MKIAYFSDQVSLLGIAPTHAAFDRIRSLADHDLILHYSTYHHKGVKGICCHTQGAPPSPGDMGDGHVCGDGLIYFRYGPMPTQAELSRMHGVPHHDFKTHRGFTLSIPIAVCSPQTISFSGLQLPEYVDDFAVLATELTDEFITGGEDGLPMDDPRVMALCSLAIQRTYRVTAELLDELGWLTTHDINPILEIVYGIDPKLSGQGTPISA